MYRYLIFLFSSHSLFAVTILHVTIGTDNNPDGTGEIGDLRYCLNIMNEGLNTTSENYEIVFDVEMTIQLNGILPIINNSSNMVNITIGNSSSTPIVAIDGMDTYSGFFIPMGNVTIQNITFQRLIAKGGDGGNGISGGGGGMGAGGAIYAPASFLSGSNPSITLMNVAINNCSAVGGNGGSYLDGSPTGNEGGGGGGGFSGNGGSITTTGNTGGGGGGGFGGDGGNVTTSTADPLGGGGGGGGGIGSRASIGTPTNLGNGGSDQENGSNGSGYWLMAAGNSSGGYIGGSEAGGGAGGGALTLSDLPSGGGGGSSSGGVGLHAEGSIPPAGSVSPSGGTGADGGGGGGGGIIFSGIGINVDGGAGSGGYGGGGGGGAGNGASDVDYNAEGGLGGIGGGGGGGGVNLSGSTSANGGNSQGGGGGGGGGPSNGTTATGGVDTGKLGGGAGGNGSSSYGGGGGGGGGSGFGGAIFMDSGLNLTIQALSGVPTTFNTTNNRVQAGIEGNGGPDSESGNPGSALGRSIFLRENSSVTLVANDADDLLTLGYGVKFIDDTIFGGTGTSIKVRGNGTVIYNGTSDYAGSITIDNANFKMNGQINDASIFVCRNRDFSLQRGTLSGSGILTGTVSVNSGIISPDTGQTLTLGNLTLRSANPISDTLGSLVHIEINFGGTSLVSVTGPTSLAGILEIDLDRNAIPGTYTILTASGITGTFDSVTFTGPTPNYSLSYLPIENPTYVQFDFLGYLSPPSNFAGKQKKNDFGLEYEIYNQLTWTSSPSPEIVGYYIYRDGEKIATLNSTTNTYEDHNRKKQVSYTYSITAFNSTGSNSSAVSIVITP